MKSFDEFANKVQRPCKCGCKYKIYAKKGPHIGVYCKTCFKFITWAPKEFIRKKIETIKTIDEIKNEKISAAIVS